jgi:hypothetical protein
MHWTTNRVNPAVAARTAMPGMTRQATAAPIGSRSPSQLRTRDMPQRNPSTQRDATKNDKDDDEDEKDDDDRETLFGRGIDDDDDGADDGSTDPHDDKAADDEPDDEKKRR